MIRLGIVGCAEIAQRRFMPAAAEVDGLQAVCVSEEYAKDKLKDFAAEYPLETLESHAALIAREDLDAIYVPQPPALHAQWARAALEAGKHVLLEKPSTPSYETTKELVDLARSKGLALHENYMFQYHSQIREIREMLADGVIGKVRLIRADFGFPLRQKNDFRYNKALGGGALLDACGYPVKLATLLLGPTAKVDSAKMQFQPEYEVDMAGSVSLSNDDGLVCQIGYGMDCGYRCSLEVWGSTGRLLTNRIFTAPPGLAPVVQIETNAGTETRELQPDSHFQHSIEAFLTEITDEAAREAMYESILLQSRLIEEIRRMGQ